LPGALLADWAAVADRRWMREPVLATTATPHPLPATPAALPRPRVLVVDDSPLVVLPIAAGEQRLLVGRCAGPAFTTSERDRCAALLSVVEGIGRLAEPAAAEPRQAVARS
jgi:hypothetical protein